MPEISFISTVVRDWVNIHSGILVPAAAHWLRTFAAIMFCICGLKIIISSIGGHASLAWMDIIRTCLLFSVASLMLHWWSSPVLWTGKSLHQILPDAAAGITKMIDDTSLSEVTKEEDAMMAKYVAPGTAASWIDKAAYGFIWFLVWFGQGLMFVLSIQGYVALAVGSILGCLSIPFIVLPGNSFFWDMVSYMVSWSMFQVVASSLVWVWSHAMLTFLHSFGTSATSVITALVLLKTFFILTCAIFWCSIRLADKITAALYGHAASAASGFSEWAISRF